MTSHREMSHCASDWELSQDQTDSCRSGPRTNSSYIMLENDSFSTLLPSLNIKSTANWNRSYETQVALFEPLLSSGAQSISVYETNWLFGQNSQAQPCPQCAALS